MRSEFSHSIRAFVRAAAIAAAIIAPLLAASTASNGAQAGVAYDQLMKMIYSSPLPTPGGFPTDYKAAMDAVTAAANVPKHHGMFAKIYDMADKAKGMAAVMKTGMPSGHYFMNNWERTDDLSTQTATIIRPDRHQIIHLDLANKTYRIEDMGTTPVMADTPPPYQPPQGGAPASPQPGTGKVDITSASSVLGPKTIDGVQTTGYGEDLKVVSSQSTGSCKDGNFETSIVEYISSITPPLAKTNPGLKYKLSGHLPPMTGAGPGCNPTMTTHHTGSVTPPADRLTIWSLMTLKGGVQTDQGPASGGISILTERGNVRDLGPGDAGLFDVPPGFTKQP